LSALGTYLSLAIEAGVPWLLSFRRTRALGFLAGFGLHFMVGATAMLGVFSVCMVAPYMAFIDRRDIDWLTSRLSRLKAGRP
jgi:hypothetical protein